MRSSLGRRVSRRQSPQVLETVQNDLPCTETAMRHSANRRTSRRMSRLSEGGLGGGIQRSGEALQQTRNDEPHGSDTTVCDNYLSERNAGSIDVHETDAGLTAGRILEEEQLEASDADRDNLREQIEEQEEEHNEVERGGGRRMSLASAAGMAPLMPRLTRSPSQENDQVGDPQQESNLIVSEQRASRHRTSTRLSFPSFSSPVEEIEQVAHERPLRRDTPFFGGAAELTPTASILHAPILEEEEEEEGDDMLERIRHDQYDNTVHELQSSDDEEDDSDNEVSHVDDRFSDVTCFGGSAKRCPCHDGRPSTETPVVLNRDGYSADAYKFIDHGQQIYRGADLPSKSFDVGGKVAFVREKVRGLFPRNKSRKATFASKKQRLSVPIVPRHQSKQSLQQPEALDGHKNGENNTKKNLRAESEGAGEGGEVEIVEEEEEEEEGGARVNEREYDEEMFRNVDESNSILAAPVRAADEFELRYFHYFADCLSQLGGINEVQNVQLYSGATFRCVAAFIRAIQWNPSVKRASTTGVVTVPTARIVAHEKGYPVAAQAEMFPGQDRAGCTRILFPPTQELWFPTVSCPDIKLRTGKWYYEVTIDKHTHGLIQLGWANPAASACAIQSKTNVGVGDCPNSWAFDCGRQQVWHRGRSRSWGKGLDKSSVIGCAIDIEAGTIAYSMGGCWDAPMGTAFRGINFSLGVFPALSAHCGSRVRLNLGRTRFSYKPPDASYRSVFDAAVLQETSRAVLPAAAHAAAGPPAQAPRQLRCLSLAGATLTGALILELLRDPYLAEQLGCLEELDLSGNNLGDNLESLQAILTLVQKSATKLHTLNLANNRLGIRGIETIVCPENLQSLFLDKNGLAGYHGGKAVARVVRKIGSLRRLSLCGNFLGDAGAAQVLSLVCTSSTTKTLKSLSLEKNDISGNDDKDFFTALRKQNLRALNLRSNPRLVSRIGKVMACCSDLKALDLSWLGLGTDHLEMLLQGLLYIPNLAKLGLGGNKLGLDGCLQIVDTVTTNNKKKFALDISASGLNSESCMELIDTLQNSAVTECDLSGNPGVDAGTALFLVERMQSDSCKRIPALRLDSPKLANAASQALLSLGVARKTTDDAQALGQLFLKPHAITSSDELEVFTALFDWSDALQTNSVFILGKNFVCKHATQLPRRTRFLGDAAFVGCANNLFVEVESLEIKHMCWIQNCPGLVTVPPQVVVGEHLVVADCPKLTAVSATSVGPTLELAHLVNLPALEALDMQSKTIRIERCASLRQIPRNAASIGLALVDCANVALVQAVRLQSMEITRCIKITAIDARLDHSLAVSQCPELVSIGPSSLQDMTVEHCDKVVLVKASASRSLTLSHLPLLQKWPPIQSCENLYANRCALLQLPPFLEVSISSRVHYCAAVHQLPSGLGRASEEFSVAGLDVAALPARITAQSVSVRHCPNIRHIRGCAPRALAIVGCASFTELLDENVPTEQAKAYCGEWQIWRCRRLQKLPKQGSLLELDLQQLPSLTTIPPGLSVFSLAVLSCSAFFNFGGTGATQRMKVGSLFLSDCARLVTVRHLVARSLCISACPRFATLEAVTSTNRCKLENVPSLVDMPTRLAEHCRSVYISEARIPQSRLEQLERASRAQGHEFEWAETDNYQYDFSHAEGMIEFNDLAQAVRFWQEHASHRKDDETLPSDITMVVPTYYRSGFQKFLSMLRKAAEFQREETKQGLAERVVEALEVVAYDEFSREEVLIRCVDAVDRCWDKPIWALNQITLTKLVSKARGDKQRLKELAKSIMRLDVVHAHAREKIKHLGGDIDDVCVYLKYEIALREALDLPVSAQHMLFPTYIKIKKRELATAKEEANAITDEQLDKWLDTWPEWQRQLRQEQADKIRYRDLEFVQQKTKRDSVQLSFGGEIMTEPVMLGKAGPFQFEELMDRWVLTGMDFANVTWTMTNFTNTIKRTSL